MPERRTLEFHVIEDVMPEVDRLLAGHVTVGTWSLGQICDHLARTITWKRPPGAVLPDPVAPAVRERFFRAGRFPDGVQVPFEALVPADGINDRAGAESLRQAIAGLIAQTGPPDDHPRLGPITREELLRFHCIHCAHHLGFAVPN